MKATQLSRLGKAWEFGAETGNILNNQESITKYLCCRIYSLSYEREKREGGLQWCTCFSDDCFRVLHKTVSLIFIYCIKCFCCQNDNTKKLH